MRRHNGAESGVKTPAQGDRETDWWAEELFYTKLPNHENNLNLNWIENYRNSQTKNNGFHYWQQQGQQQSIIIFFFQCFGNLSWLLATLTPASCPPRPRCSCPCCPPACSRCTSSCRAPPSQASPPRNCSSSCSREQTRAASSLSSLCLSCKNSCRSTLCSRHTSFR